MRLGLRRGRSEQDRLCRALRDGVMRARAQARLKAEVSILAHNALAWLTRGPGKETEGSPGWTVPVKPSPRSDTSINVLMHPEFLAIITRILEKLSPFPEARAAAAEAIQQQKNVLDHRPAEQR
jgi:hypothetical protein